MSSSEINLESFLIPLEEINRATENFSQQRCIGGGGFGAVYKGQLSERWQNRTAAIKRHGKDSYQGEHEFRNEVEMISRFHHENIIPFIGYCDESNEMIIVYEYVSNESLDHHLRDPDRMRCMTWIQRLGICIGAARGLNYLHSGLGEDNRVIHRDVKSANILLDGDFMAKICDFGLSKLGPRNQPDTELYTRVAGTQFYMDPAYHESRILRKESDVYSFGVVLFEILSGMLVYLERSIGDERQFLMNTVRRYHRKEQEMLIDPLIRDQINSRSLDTFKEIAYQCINLNITERPTMATVINKIEEALTIQVRFKIDSLHPHQRYSTGAYHRRIVIDIPHPANSKAKNVILSQAGAVPLIIHLMREGTMEVRENAVATFISLSVVERNKLSIDLEGAIPVLVELLSKGTEREKKDVATALFNLCTYLANKGRAVRAGVVPILIEILTEPRGVLKDEALAILAILSTHPEGKLAIGKAKAVAVLVEVIRYGSRDNKVNAVTVLVELCSSDHKYLVEAQLHEQLLEKREDHHHEHSDSQVEVEDEEGLTLHPYDRLTTVSTDPAPDIDFSKRETYLSSSEFRKKFGMAKQAFYKLPKWKQNHLKIGLKLAEFHAA